MIFPIRTDRPLRSTPYVNYGLILLNVTLFALQKLAEGGALRWEFMSWSLDPGEPTLATFFTYAFLHGGWMHLIGNMVFLYIFGNNVSDKLGPLGYFAFYLAGGVFAGIGYVLLAAPNAAGMYPKVLGASGAVAAVTGAYLVLFPRSRITVLLFFILIGTFEVPGLWFVLIFFLKDLFSALGPSTGVAHTAHIAGTLFGVAVSLGLLATRLLERDQWDLLAILSRWNRRRQFKSAVAKGWDPYGTLPAPEERGGGGKAGSRLGWGRAGRGGGGGPPALPDAGHLAVMEVRAQVSEAMAHRDLAGAVGHYLRLRQLDPGQVLSRNAQLDIANQLAEMGKFPEAADAYELFLRHYPDSDQHPHIELLAGLLYARYLNDPAKASARIEHALPRLTNARDIELAKAELARLKTTPAR